MDGNGPLMDYTSNSQRPVDYVVQFNAIEITV